ncbi:acyl-CoA dehydrogenase family protein [Leucobacter sp. GX24907]
MTATGEIALIHDAATLAREGAAQADREDRSLEQTFAQLGELGALGLGAGTQPGGTEDIGAYARLIGAVASECMSTAFSLWAHRMVITYLNGAGDDLAPLLDDLVAGRRAGSIAMATAMQELAGIGEIPTRAVPDGAGGYHVHGVIAWASNIVEGTVVVLPAHVVESLDAPHDSGERIIVAAVVGEAGLETREVEDLLALGATRSAMLRFTGLHVPSERVIATSLEACRANRSTHLLLQTAFCTGLAERCISEVSDRLEGSGSAMTSRHSQLEEESNALASALTNALGSLETTTPAEVTRIRYEAGRLAYAAARHESALIGGRGYVTTHATNRRLREATFLPVQSPSEVQLLQELEGFGIDPDQPKGTLLTVA